MLVERDALAFLHDQVESYGNEAIEWSLLFDDVEVEQPGAALVAASRVCHLSFDDDRLAFAPLHHYRHALEPIEHAVRNRAWCAHVARSTHEIFGEQISIQLELEPSLRARIRAAVEEHARDVAAILERGVGALLAIIRPDVPPAVPAALAEARAAIERARDAKLARLEAIRDPG